MDPAWIQCGFTIGDQQVQVSVRRLNPDQRRRVAAEIAWFAEGLLSTGRPCSPEWKTLLDRILTQDVAVTLDQERLGHGRDAWDQLVCRTFEAFLTANQLDRDIKR